MEESVGERLLHDSVGGLVDWLAVGVVWFLSRRWRKPRSGGLDRVKEIVAERYARGELLSDEYRQRLAELGE